MVSDQDPNLDLLDLHQDLQVHLRDQLHPLQDALPTDLLLQHQHQDHFHPLPPLAVQDQMDLMDLLVALDLVVVLDLLVSVLATDLLVVLDQVDSMEEMDLLVVLDLLGSVVAMDPLVVLDQVVMVVDPDLLALAVVTDLPVVLDQVVDPDLLALVVVTDQLVVLELVVTVVVMDLLDVLVLVAVVAVQDPMVQLKHLVEVVKVAGSKVRSLLRLLAVPTALLLFPVPVPRNLQFSTNSRALTSTSLVLAVSVPSMKPLVQKCAIDQVYSDILQTVTNFMNVTGINGWKNTLFMYSHVL